MSGWTYVYLTDNGKIQDPQPGIGLIIRGSMPINAKQTFNDEYQLGLPFLAKLGRRLIVSKRPSGN